MQFYLLFLNSFYAIGSIFYVFGMISIYKSADITELTREVEYPTDFLWEEGFSEKKLQLVSKGFTGKRTIVQIEGLFITYGSVDIKQPYILETYHDFPFIKMQFEIEGRSDFKSDIKHIPDVLIRGGQHQLFYLPEVNGKLTYTKSRNVFEVLLSESFLRKKFGESFDNLGLLKNALAQQTPYMLNKTSLPITLEMRQLISDIISCPFTDTLRKVWIECKVMELLMLQINQMHNCCLKNQAIKGSDLEKLQQVKQIIETSIENPKTIVQLSELVGINDFKLKRDFKSVFGTTIFGYLTQIRLEKAKQLILDGHQLKEIAYLVGYRHQQHLTSAFKRYYKCLPKSLKLAILISLHICRLRLL